MELAGYSRPTCNKVRARPSTSFLDTSIDLPWRNTKSRVREEIALILEVPEFLIIQFRIGQRKLPCPKPALSVKSFRYNAGL